MHLCGLNLNSSALLDTSIATEKESVSGWTTFLVQSGARRIGQEGNDMHILFIIDDTPLTGESPLNCYTDSQLH